MVANDGARDPVAGWPWQETHFCSKMPFPISVPEGEDIAFAAGGSVCKGF
jgi:hypothetical protein